MLRFIKQNLETIAGVEIFPLISLLIFVAFFTIVLIRVIRMKKANVAEISDYPLHDGSEENDNYFQNIN